jgi:hypothetical protein
MLASESWSRCGTTLSCGITRVFSYTLPGGNGRGVPCALSAPSLPSILSLSSCLLQSLLLIFGSLFFVLVFQRSALLGLVLNLPRHDVEVRDFSQYIAYVHRGDEGKARVLTSRSSQTYNSNISWTRVDLNPSSFVGIHRVIQPCLSDGEYTGIRLVSDGESTIVSSP